jgi:hypothetical protein
MTGRLLPWLALMALLQAVSAQAQPTSPQTGADLLSKVYPAAVQEVLEQRCIVCHGCYDAPCQLKMDAWAGLARGAHKEKVYDGVRLRPAQLTRLYEDALTIEGWRDKGFYPVLDSADPRQGQVYRMLALKQEYPLPGKGPLPDDFDFSLDRNQSCPKPEEFADYTATSVPTRACPTASPDWTRSACTP